MGQQSVAQLGLEPRALGRHDAAGVRNRQQVGDVYRMKSESHGGIALADPTLQFGGSARAADEINALVRPDVADPEHGPKRLTFERLYIQRLGPRRAGR